MKATRSGRPVPVRLALGLVMTLATALGVTTQGATARQVVRAPDPSLSLESRWQWAMERCRDTSCTIGYSIARWMPASDRIGWFDRSSESRPTLAELLGEKAGHTVSENVRAVYTGRPGSDWGPIVEKQVALLFRLPRGVEEPALISQATFDTPIDLDGTTLLWLGSSELDESFDWLVGRFGSVREEAVWRNLVWAVAQHQAPDRVIPWLTRIAKGDGPVEVRKAAIYALSDFDPRRVRPVLVELAETGGPLP